MWHIQRTCKPEEDCRHLPYLYTSEKSACIVLLPTGMCRQQRLTPVIAEQRTRIQLSVDGIRTRGSQMSAAGITQEASAICGTIKSKQLQEVHESEGS